MADPEIIEAAAPTFKSRLSVLCTICGRQVLSHRIQTHRIRCHDAPASILAESPPETPEDLAEAGFA